MLCILLCSCSNHAISDVTPPVPTELPSDTNNSQETVKNPAEAPDQSDNSLPPSDNMVHSRLTNDWVDANTASTRPIAVIIPNESNALPHYNLSNASVLYEAPVEGCITRMLGIFEDWTNLEKIGNIRSLRSYFAYWAFEWDAFIVHSGQPFFVNELLEQPDTQTINESVSSDSTAFFRDPDRPMPHNAYATGAGILNVVSQNGYSTDYRNLCDTAHFHFAPMNNPNTLEQYGDKMSSAAYIDLTRCYPLTRCYFEYSAEDGLYYRFQQLSGSDDGPHIDIVTGKQLCFKNILVQSVTAEDIGDGYLRFSCLDTAKEGWFFTEGHGIHVTWEKKTEYGATRFYDDFGNEIALNTGKTMICIIRSDDSFVYR